MVKNCNGLRTAIETNSKLTCGELASVFQVHEEIIPSHLHQLGKRWKLSKWIFHSLTPENKLQRLTICSSHLTRSKTEPLFDRILTCDEKWIMYSNRKRSRHWLSPNDCLPQIPHVQLTQKKFYYVYDGLP
jgi:histone-lysine N-methyltransferase SETMAR